MGVPLTIRCWYNFLVNAFNVSIFCDLSVNLSVVSAGMLCNNLLVVAVSLVLVTLICMYFFQM